MTFKEYLNERASYYKEDCNLLEYGFLPLTNVTSKILGGGEKIESFHATSMKYLPNLKKIKGDKGVSTFTKGLGSIIQNINIKPDVLAKIEGNIVLKSDKDAFTHLDKSGMRWINLRTIQNDRKKYDFIWDAFTGKTIKFMNDKFDLNMDQEDIDEKFVCDYWSKLKPSDKKTVKDFYIKHTEDLLKQKLYLDIVKDILENNKTDYKHNEIIVNHFKVLGVYSLEAGKYTYDNSMAEYDINKLGYKYLGHIKKEDFNDLDKF